MSARVAELTGLDPQLVRQRNGRIGTRTFVRERYRSAGRVASPYDATVTTADPDPSAEASHYADPVLQGLAPPLTSAMLDLYANRLGWRPEGQYRLSNQEAYEQWNWGRGINAPESVSSLGTALALDSRLHVLVAQGLTDLVTPYFGTQILLNQLPDFGPDRLRLVVYPGGHMFYMRDASRAALRDEAKAMMSSR
jgi:carboxypeptidase C (cathepsin A)